MDTVKPNDLLSSPMRDYFKNKTIFITGGTGFLGKLLIEKLLRCEVKEIIIMVRPKKNMSAQERVSEFFNEPIFVGLLAEKEKHLAKLCVIEGDVQQLNLGLSSASEDIIKERTQIAMHLAADVRFDESLRDAILINVRATRDFLCLAQSIKNLEVVLYMSTAYSNSTRSFITEEFYPPPIEPDVIIKLAESLTPDSNIDVISQKIISPWANTYAYTKQLAEDVVRQFGKKLPICIIRPSIVLTTYEDPIPGWTNNLYGVNGVIIGVAVGILKILHIDHRKLADIVPADLVINATLAVTWYTAKEHQSVKNVESLPGEETKDDSVKIYNYTSHPDNPINWEQLRRFTMPYASHYPVQKALWKSTYNATRYYAVYEFLKIFYHIIPALFMDFYLRLTNRKPKLLKMYRKIHKFSGAIAFVTNNQWKFGNSNLRKIIDGKINWPDFFMVYVKGLRQYITKEDLTNIKEAKIRYKYLTILHYFLLSIFYSFLLFMLYIILQHYKLICGLDEITARLTHLHTVVANFVSMPRGFGSGLYAPASERE